MCECVLVMAREGGRMNEEVRHNEPASRVTRNLIVNIPGRRALSQELVDGCARAA